MDSNPALTIYKQEFSDLINTSFEIMVLDNTCTFSEGPVWNDAGFYLFSDIPENITCKISASTKKEIFINQSGCTHNNLEILAAQIGSNGLAYDSDGTLYICQHGNGAIAKWDGEEVQSFIAGYNDRRFNSPNDIVISKSGSIFFSDPPYGLKDQQLVPGSIQPIAGIYCHRDGKTTLISDAYQYPNGLCLSPNGEILYCCSNKPFERFVLMYDAKTLAAKGTLCEENGDGIKCDKEGNLWLCAKEGILILDSNGDRLGKIELPTVPANCCWGGKQDNDLLITARENIFLISDILKIR